LKNDVPARVAPLIVPIVVKSMASATAFTRVTSEKLAPSTFARVMFAPVKFAPVSVAPVTPRGSRWSDRTRIF